MPDTTINLDSSWTPARISEYLAKNPSRIRYSTDRGANWLILRGVGDQSPLTRIIAMLSNGYVVRLEYDNRKENEVSTSTQRAAESVFRGVSDSNVKPKTRSTYAYVYYNEAEGYTFSALSSAGNRQKVCMVERHTVYSMSVPNTNDVTLQNPLNSADMANYGMVFTVQPVTPPLRQRWGALIQQSTLSQRSDIGDFLYVTCARVGDDEMETKILHDLMAVAVIGDKYVTSKTNKLGDAFLLHKTHWKNFQERVDACGAWARYEDLEEAQVTAENPEVSKPIQNVPTEAEPATNVASTLAAIVHQGKPDEIMEAMTLAIQYRDEQIEGLKRLNEVIETARKAIIDASFA